MQQIKKKSLILITHRLATELDLFAQIYHIYTKYWDRQAEANSAEPEQMLQNMASYQSLHCLPFILHCLSVMRFYRSVNPLASCPAWLVYLTTLFPGQVDR